MSIVSLSTCRPQSRLVDATARCEQPSHARLSQRHEDAPFQPFQAWLPATDTAAVVGRDFAAHLVRGGSESAVLSCTYPSVSPILLLLLLLLLTYPTTPTVIRPPLYFAAVLPRCRTQRIVQYSTYGIPHPSPCLLHIYTAQR